MLGAGQSLSRDSDELEGGEPLSENPALGRIQGVLFVDDDAGGHEVSMDYRLGMDALKISRRKLSGTVV